MKGTRDTEMPLGTVLERGVTWGLPVSPLLMAMLMTLAQTPSALPAHEANALYLSCMAGAIAGFALCLGRRLFERERTRRVACLCGGAALEVAWFLLTAGIKTGGPMACTVGGTLLVGASTAVLLVLWLSVGQTASIVCELVKYAVALGCAFVVYSLLDIMPSAGWASFLFPAATCIPLFMRLGGAGAWDEDAAPARHAGHPATVVLPVSVLLAAFGAGLAMLGYGGQRAEYGAGLAALVLVAVLAARSRINPAALAGQLAAPLVIVSLCYASLYQTGTPFALLLAGCGAFVAWLLVSARRTPDAPGLGGVHPRNSALLLGWVTLCAAAGLMVEDALAFTVGIDSRAQAIALIGIIAAVDLAWRTCVFGPNTHAREEGSRTSETQGAGDAAPGMAADATASPARRLEHAYTLSPREAEVAALLCENRSASYICVALELAPSTAKTHIRHIYEKTGVHSRSELQLLAEGLDAPSDARG